jgi:purine-nucleoside/S-methyl-5'-thioadenosine phosphorylase / adenosine deaminase
MCSKPLPFVKQYGVISSDLLTRIPWVWHGFGTRLAEGWPGEYTQLKQTHSDIVFAADDGRGCIGEGDALISSTAGQKIGIRTADCVPLLLADPDRPVVAAVHAGWRGTVAEIAIKAVRRMHEDYGSDPRRIYAAMGPAIGECCFEVGVEVAEQFTPWFANAKNLTHVNLTEANYRQLLDAGLLAEHVDDQRLCTACDAQQFHSFRRDREQSGRMVAAIAIL